MVAIAVRILKAQSPKLRMIISFADPAQGHHGGIYQAGNWVFTGDTAPDYEYFVGGKWVHHRTATSKRTLTGLQSRKLPCKHRYLMPLDKEMKDQIEPLRKPYPKREKQAMAGPPAQRRGSADLHAPTQKTGRRTRKQPILEDSGEANSPLITNGS